MVPNRYKQVDDLLSTAPRGGSNSGLGRSKRARCAPSLPFHPKGSTPKALESVSWLGLTLAALPSSINDEPVGGFEPPPGETPLQSRGRLRYFTGFPSPVRYVCGEPSRGPLGCQSLWAGVAVSALEEDVAIVDRVALGSRGQADIAFAHRIGAWLDVRWWDVLRARLVAAGPAPPERYAAAIAARRA